MAAEVITGPRGTQPGSPQTDPFAYRTVVIILGTVILVVVLGGIILTAISKTLPEGVLAIGSAGIGGLVGLLAPSPTKQNSTVYAPPIVNPEPLPGTPAEPVAPAH